VLGFRTTAENLSRYLAELVAFRLEKNPDVKSVTVTLFETETSSASFTCEVDHADA